MQHRERIAHHEAAHVVMAWFWGAGVLDQGMDIDAPSSVEGAYGRAAVSLFLDDEGFDFEERARDLLRNLTIIFAGAASDAKIAGKSLNAAIDDQPGDKNVALHLLKHSTTVNTAGEQIEQLSK